MDMVLAGILINANKASASQNGTIIYTIIMVIIVWLLVWLVRKFYRFFLKKFGYEIINEKDES